MCIDRWLRLIAGLLIMLSVAGYIFVSKNFIWFILFIGFNLFQSAFTQWCPMISILKKLGVKK